MIVVSRLRLSMIDIELLSDNNLMVSSTRKQLEKPQVKPLPVLGQPKDLSRRLLPTKQDVLLFIFFKRDDEFVSNNKKKAYFNDVKREVIDEIVAIFNTVPQPTSDVKNIEVKLKKLLDTYLKAKMHPGNKSSKQFQADLIQHLVLQV